MTVYISGTTGYSGPVGVLGDLTTTGNTILGDQSTDTLNVANGNLVLNSSGLMTVPAGGVIQGLTVGLGAGSVANNTAVGVSALAANTTGSSNTAVGQNALLANTDGTQNTAVGRSALIANTSGVLNSGFGRSSLVANTTGSNNTAIGALSLAANTTASNNTAIGHLALTANTTGTSNTSVGQNSLRSVTTNADNTAVGTNAARDVTGSANSAFGSAALIQTTTGSNNTAIGQTALFSNTTGINNNALGYQAGYNLTTGSYNVFIGSRSGSTGATAITVSANTCVGEGAGFVLQGAAGSNTFLGQSSGSLMTTGSSNTIIGRFQGNGGGLDIRTASNYIVLSDGDGNPRAYHNGYNWFSTSGGFISKTGSTYTNTYNTDSSWSSGWSTIIPGGVMYRDQIFLIQFLWNFTSGAQPYYLDSCMIFHASSTNGTGGGNEVALISSTHTGDSSYYYLVRSVANNSSGGNTSGIQVKLINVTNNGQLVVRVVQIANI